MWAARPPIFRNGEKSQQHYANVIKTNYSHSGLPLGFFNHCWKAHRFARVTDACTLQTYHATCEMVAKSKRQAMNNSISGVEKHGCAMATEGVLTRHQLRAYARRRVAPARLTMQQRDA